MNLKEIAKLLISFNKFIKSSKVNNEIRKKSTDFIRKRKFVFYDVLHFLIFRSEKCIPAELTKFFCDIDKLKNRISRQAAFKALKKVNPNVFYLLIRKFSELFYSSDLVKTFKGYVLLSVDGTSTNLIATDESIDKYEFHRSAYIKNKEDAKKATSRNSAIYDVTNGLIVDYEMSKWTDSEISLLVKQLERSHDFYDKHKAILLADRNYPGVELFSIIEHYDMKYCIRGKTNFFKKYLEDNDSNDTWIEIELDKLWLKRLKYDIAKERFEKDNKIKVRVVKYNYTYKDKRGHEVNNNLIYFTNLSEEEFTAEEIATLYTKRWDIECSFKTLKTDYEWERYFSKECDTETCALLAKVIFHNITGVLRKELNKHLEENNDETNKYKYCVNIVELSKLLRKGNIIKYIRNNNKNKIISLLETIKDLINKTKVPIRPNRHSKRWGRHLTSAAPFRYRIDGRNNPNSAYINGHLQTVKPI